MAAPQKQFLATAIKKSPPALKSVVSVVLVATTAVTTVSSAEPE